MKHLGQSPRRVWLKAAEGTLFGAGAAALAYCSFFFLDGAVRQMQGETEFAELTQARVGVPPERSYQAGDLLGRLQIPKLGISTIVFEGTSESELRGGVGHVRGTSTELSTGNIALAAHRDTFFRGLGEIQAGDGVILETAEGRGEYRVVETKIVNPDAVEVLRPTPSPALTLITCYPFEFFGHAPQRFVVRAEKASQF